MNGWTVRIVAAVALNVFVVGVLVYFAGRILRPPVGTIIGVVRFDGTPPADRPMRTASATLSPQSSIEVGPDGGLAHVFVWVSNGPENEGQARRKEPVLLEQRQDGFAPRIVAVQAGQPLAIRNRSSTARRMKFISTNNGVFSVRIPNQRLVYQRIFDEPEIGIRLHGESRLEQPGASPGGYPGGRAYVHVVEHPFHAITGRDGRFSITNLPAGRYELSFWHESLALMPDPVSIELMGNRPVETIVVTYGQR